MKLQSLLTRISLLSAFVALTVSSALAQTSAVPARLAQSVDLHNLVTLQGNVHPLARQEFDQGVAPNDLPMERMLLVLQRSPDQESALRQLLDEQQVRSSAQFHQWLAPEQFGRQFGPADSDLQAVTGWLTSQGFQVAKVSQGKTVIEFSGSAGLVRQVLGTEIHKFRVNGQDYWANTSDPQIPAALAPVVAGFASLNNFPAKAMHENLRTITRPAAQGKAQPLFTYPVVCPGESDEQCYTVYLGPTDFATIYNVLPLWDKSTDGTGVTIAVVGESNINPQDVADFRTMFGLPANPNSLNVIVNGPNPGLASDETEADLDVEWSGAVAKGATIDLVVSESTEATLGVDLSALYIIDNDLGPIMSESYGVCEAQSGAGGNIFHSTLWEQAAAEGITVLLASGDSGSAVCDRADPNFGVFAAQYGLSVSGFASTPYNVAVGGTNLNITSSNISKYFTVTNTPNSNSSAVSYIPEITWNDSCAASGSLTGCTPPPSTTYLDAGVYLVGGSGGASNCISPTGTFPNVTCSGKYPKPSWQTGTGVPNDGARDLPDVSLLATGYVICQMDANGDENSSLTTCNLDAPQPSFQVVGGTSASVQAFAGIMAMVDQAHGRQGNANYVLYPLAAESGASCNSSTIPVNSTDCIFYDVTAGNNSVICVGGSPNCSNTNSASGQYGILVSGNPSVAAFTTTSGYDLATGLGSVNAANLVTNWKSNFTPSSITLALSTNPATNPITLTHGQPIDYTITASSSGGTPSGDVSLIAQAGEGTNQTTAIGPFTLSVGSATGSTIMLPGGAYNVTAHYAGNGTLAASDSSPGIPVVVNKESSKTQLELVTMDPTTGAPSYGATTIGYGSPYFLRMDVTNTSGQSCAAASTGLISYPCPTGAISVSPPPTELSTSPNPTPGQYSLNARGYAEDQPIQLGVGQYSYVANYAGDNSFDKSVSAALPVAVTKASTTITLTGMPSAPVPAPPGITVNAVLETQSNAVAPTGTMQLLNNGVATGFPVTIFGTAASSTAFATAQAQFYPNTPEGNYSFSVQYSGDGNYAVSTSAASTVKSYDFILSASPTDLTISAPGQSAHTTISIAPENGFAEATNLTCSSGPDIGLTCTVSPATLNLTGSSTLTATLTITTTGSSNLPPMMRWMKSPPAPPLPTGGWLWLLVAFLGWAILALATLSRRRASFVLAATVLMVAGTWIACGGGGGGGSSGPAPAPGLSLSATSLSFGQVALGSSSAPQSVTLTNTGNAALDLGGNGLGGADYIDFNMTQNNCFNAVVPPAGTCVTQLEFSPQAAGQRTASITYTGNSNTYGTVTMSGTGVLPPTPPGNYSVQLLAVTANDDLVHTIEVPFTVQ